MTDRSIMMLLVAGLLGVPSLVSAQTIPAFPGADGAAANVTGGRAGVGGSIVYHVTRLESAIDDPERLEPGTLRYGLNTANFPAGVPRTLVFDVGGVFNLGRLPQEGWDPNGNGWDAQSRLTVGGTNVTLAGQTAPGAGVNFMGGGLKPQGSNNIIRNITVAAGYGMRNWWEPGEPFPEAPVPLPPSPGVGIFPDATVFDGMDISGTNLMIDHVSTLYCTDEGISMNERANNITVQYSNISQGQNYPQWDAEGGGFTGHALGSLLQAGPAAAISFHHNLYAHQKGRVPQISLASGQTSGGYYDFRNNVVYNWLGTAGSKSGTTFLNLINNFYLAGNGGDNPIGGNNTGITTASGGTGVLSGSSSVYRDGNLRDTNKDGDPDDGTLVSGGAASPLWSGGVVTYAGTTDAARVAFDRVLDYVGANWWTRDDVIDTPDERTIDEARTGTGKIIAWADNPWNNDPAEGVEWRTLKNTPETDRPADWDTEAAVNANWGVGDGMPTYWELQHSLDPNTRDDAGDFDNDGYTNLEEYLNDVAAWPAPNAIVFNNAHGDSRFAHILNWDANPGATSVHPWQPSRFDEAQINNGTVVVDSVGQHAGKLVLGANPGDNATLNITSGWLKVESPGIASGTGEVIIGADAGATAALNLSGGELSASLLTKGAGGSMSFTGGTLRADGIDFSLVNDGGTLAAGDLSGGTIIDGDYQQLATGTLEIEIMSLTESSAVAVTGEADLAGLVNVVLDPNFTLGENDSFEILIAGTLVDSGIALAAGGDNDLFRLDMDTETGIVTLLAASAAIPGDYNGDGTVDAADYTVWRDTLGSTTDLRANGDDTGESQGIIDEADFAVWKANFGTTAGSGSGQSVPVPEPSAIALAAMCLAAFMRRRR